MAVDLMEGADIWRITSLEYPSRGTRPPLPVAPARHGTPLGRASPTPLNLGPRADSTSGMPAGRGWLDVDQATGPLPCDCRCTTAVGLGAVDTVCLATEVEVLKAQAPGGPPVAGAT